MNEIKIYGCTENQIDLEFASADNINMRLASMLSDAQECIRTGQNDMAIKIINKVKYYFFEYTNTRDFVIAEKLVTE